MVGTEEREPFKRGSVEDVESNQLLNFFTIFLTKSQNLL
jgi:hypothetical protein